MAYLIIALINTPMHSTIISKNFLVFCVAQNLISKIDMYCGAGEIDNGTCGERDFFFGLSVENLSHSDEKQIEKIEF